MRRNRQLAGIGRFARAFWRAITVNRKVMAGSAIVGVFVLVAIFGPLIIRQNPLALHQGPRAAAITSALARHEPGWPGCLHTIGRGHAQLARSGRL